MARRVFLSFQHRDLARARGFDLMRRSPRVRAEFSVRHLLQPVNSTNPGYVGQRIRAQIMNTSVTVVLIGRETHRSDWVAREIEWSVAKDHPNGLLGIAIEPGATIPEGLTDYGAEILNWTAPATLAEFEQAIERAALRAGRASAIRASAAGAGGGSGCQR